MKYKAKPLLRLPAVDIAADFKRIYWILLKRFYYNIAHLPGQCKAHGAGEKRRRALFTPLEIRYGCPRAGALPLRLLDIHIRSSCAPYFRLEGPALLTGAFFLGKR